MAFVPKDFASGTPYVREKLYANRQIRGYSAIRPLYNVWHFPSLFHLAITTFAPCPTLFITVSSFRYSPRAAILQIYSLQARSSQLLLKMSRFSLQCVCNSLPESVRASPSLQVVRNRLKTKLFARSYS